MTRRERQRYKQEKALCNEMLGSFQRLRVLHEEMPISLDTLDLLTIGKLYTRILESRILYIDAKTKMKRKR